MRTNFQQSAYQVLKIFADANGQPVPKDEVYKRLRRNNVSLFLGADTTLADFLEALVVVRELNESDKGYSLTERGSRQLGELSGD